MGLCRPEVPLQLSLSGPACSGCFHCDFTKRLTRARAHRHSPAHWRGPISLPAPVRGQEPLWVSTWAGIGPGWRGPGLCTELPEVGNRATGQEARLGGLHHSFCVSQKQSGSGEPEVYLSEGFSDHGACGGQQPLLAFGEPKRTGRLLRPLT